MVVSDIIRKTELSQAEMQFVVEQYIKERKGVNVNIHIALPTNSFERLSMHFAQDQIIKLTNAYNDACGWYLNKTEPIN